MGTLYLRSFCHSTFLLKHLPRDYFEWSSFHSLRTKTPLLCSKLWLAHRSSSAGDWAWVKSRCWPVSPGQESTSFRTPHPAWTYFHLFQMLQNLHMVLTKTSETHYQVSLQLTCNSLDAKLSISRLFYNDCLSWSRNQCYHKAWHSKTSIIVFDARGESLQLKSRKRWIVTLRKIRHENTTMRKYDF